MDPTIVWTELAKMGSGYVLGGIIIWYLVGVIKELRADLRSSQEARLTELKEGGALYNQAIKQLDTTTQLIAATPKALADFQEKMRDSVDDLTTIIQDLQRDLRK